jgi:manganese-dependent ADP-ribose/CDP-alcohol diphosphatase
VPIHPAAAAYETLLWNYDEVLATLHDFPNVLASLSGHTHEHAVHRDEKGILHYVLAAPLECPPEVDAFSTAIVYTDRIVINGFGLNSNVTIPCKPFTSGAREHNANL